MPTHSFRWSPEGSRSPLILAVAVLFVCRTAYAQTQVPAPAQKYDTSASASDEKLLEPNHVIELAPGDVFAVRVPLRVTKATNLGAAELRITLAPDATHAESEEDVVLIAHLNAGQVFLARGNQALQLHGTVPALPKTRRGPWHASDYTIHLGSGNTVNLGTPDDQLIDTKALTESLSRLHLKLVAPANE